MRSVLSFCQGLPERRFTAGEVLLAEGAEDSELYVLI
jgi:hypothetical protein